MAEHAYNNSASSTTGMTPCYVNNGRHPESRNPQRMEVMNTASCVYVHRIKRTFENSKKALYAARDGMTEITDTRCLPLPAYKIGDTVIRLTKHIKIKRPSRMLDHKFLSPFQIDKIILRTAV